MDLPDRGGSNLGPDKVNLRPERAENLRFDWKIFWKFADFITESLEIKGFIKEILKSLDNTEENLRFFENLSSLLAKPINRSSGRLVAVGDYI